MTVPQSLSKFPIDPTFLREKLTPMPCLDILQPKQWEELSDHWDHLIWHIRAPGPANKQRPLLEPGFLRIERKVGNPVQRSPEYPQWHSGCDVRGVGKPGQICKQELPDTEVGLVLFQDGVGFGLTRDVCIFDLAHRTHIDAE